MAKRYSPRDFYRDTLPPVRTEKESEKMHNDIQDAIKHFQEKGGLIKKLPDQFEPPSNRVNSLNGDAYEPIEGLQPFYKK